MAIDMIKAHQVVEQVVLSSDTPGEGLICLIDYCRRMAPENAWDELLNLDWETDSLILQGWLQKILFAEPPAADIKAFWFGLFQAQLDGGEETYLLYIAGSNEYDRDDNTADWACDPAYFPEDRYMRSKVLDEVYRFLRDQDEQTKLLGEYLLLMGYAGLMLKYILPSVDARLLLGSAISRGIVVGYDDGDFILLGELTGNGWAE